MVAGRVVDTVDTQTSVLIQASDGSTRYVLYVEHTPAARSVSPGDAVSWTADHVYWTPKCGGFRNYPLTRVSTSHAVVSRQEEPLCA
jgi:hypothetical protein